jgi:hypothetical protein
MLTNALLRIEKPTGILPPPFEEVASKIWILEIPVRNKNEAGQFSGVTSFLTDRSDIILNHRTEADLTLHLSVQCEGPVRIPPDLVLLAATFGASIEIYQARN